MRRRCCRRTVRQWRGCGLAADIETREAVTSRAGRIARCRCDRNVTARVAAMSAAAGTQSSAKVAGYNAMAEAAIACNSTF